LTTCIRTQIFEIFKTILKLKDGIIYHYLVDQNPLKRCIVADFKDISNADNNQKKWAINAWHARGRRFDSDILHKGFTFSKAFFMSFHVYILYSETVQQYYVGHTDNLEDRFYRHTNSGSKATKKAKDWKLVHTEFFETKAGAYRREMEIKNKKSRKYIEWLIRSAN
jgi:putative endonuclease